MSGAGQFIQKVRIDDAFWSVTRETVRREGIPYQWRALNDLIPDAEPSYCMRNFRIAAGKEQGEHAGCADHRNDQRADQDSVRTSFHGSPLSRFFRRVFSSCFRPALYA